jgi:hypothetical protein
VANDNPDYARLDVGRIATIRGAALTVAQNSSANFDTSWTDPLVWTLRYNLTYFNSTLAGNQVGIVGSPSGAFLSLANVAVANATNLLFNWGEDTVFTSAIDLTLMLPGDTSYQLQVRTGPTTTAGGWGVTIYAGPQL